MVVYNNENSFSMKVSSISAKVQILNVKLCIELYMNKIYVSRSRIYARHKQNVSCKSLFSLKSLHISWTWLNKYTGSSKIFYISLFVLPLQFQIYVSLKSIRSIYSYLMLDKGSQEPQCQLKISN